MTNLTHEQLVEKVARELCRAYGLDPDKSVPAHGTPYVEPQWNTKYGLIATVAIATIAEAIKEPTEAMMEAVDCGGDKKDWLSGRAWTAGYRSMHAASPLYPESKP